MFFKAANQTFHQADNLAGQTGYYVRVRAFTGTLTAPEAGEWSASSMGMTGVAPVPTPTSLSAPDDLRSDDRDDDSISLAWDEVTGADGYEVEQREDGGSWEEASCGGGDGTVSETSCVASDLDSGTEYDFRVRALPEDEDENTASDWTVTPSAISTTGTTTTTPPPTSSGGSGDLNLTWETAGPDITWYWDQSEDRTATYERWQSIAVPTGVNFDAQCPPADDAEWTDANENAPSGVTGARTEDTDPRHPVEGATRGAAYLLCVRAVVDDKPGPTSFAWAGIPMGVGDPSRVDDERRRTTALTFGVHLDPGFNYAFRRVSTSPTDTTFRVEDCDSGTALADEVSDVPNLDLSSYRITGLSPYTRYGLCYRAQNSAGASEWAFHGTGIITLPSAPPAPSAEDSTIEHDKASRNAVWNVSTSGRAGVPRAAENTTNYEVKVLSMPTRNPLTSDTDDSASARVPDLALSHCEEKHADHPEPSTTVGLSNTQDGFSITFGVGAAQGAYDADNAASTGDVDYRVCVRAQLSTTAGDQGPWTIGSRVVKQDQPE